MATISTSQKGKFWTFVVVVQEFLRFKAYSVFLQKIHDMFKSRIFRILWKLNPEPIYKISPNPGRTTFQSIHKRFFIITFLHVKFLYNESFCSPQLPLIHFVKLNLCVKALFGFLIKLVEEYIQGASKLSKTNQSISQSPLSVL